MENTPKKYGKLISFAPLVTYAIWSVGFLLATGGYVETSSIGNHFAWMTAMLLNYSVLLWTFVFCGVLAFSVLVYLIVHVARLKTLDAGDKILWIIFMACFGPLAFPVFYLFELRKEPNELDVYPNIA